ncbi:MAG: hypothetical protein MUF06_02020 [Pirellulaceae bacterium]|jgi:hypothetical protein|nr:hypothetical protein [Pirellulaceae bacterium]
MLSDVLKLGSRIVCLPVIHGSGEFALAVRRVMLQHSFDCVAVPLPPSFQAAVERGIDRLPAAGIVTQAETPHYPAEWSPDLDADEDIEDESDAEFADASDDGGDDDEPTHSYVPIDPCQPVIAALRAALAERIPRAFIDLETDRFVPQEALLPDAYALKQVAIERFAAAVLPAIPRPADPQHQDRIKHMAAGLRELETRHTSILFVCSLLDWPWIREAYTEERASQAEHDLVEPPKLYAPDPRTLLFLLGELPFITGLYERARAELEDDENLSIDGVKELLVTARERYRADLKRRARKITPHTLRQCLKYIRNLALFEKRFTPDLYTLVIAAKQTAGDQYALHVAETAREYPYEAQSDLPQIKLGIGRGQFPGGEIVRLVSRLPGPPVEWRSCDLVRRPDRIEREMWQMRWNPFSQCSWPPEDTAIENFRAHVFDRARAVLGADLARTEPFTTSILDGIDIRDTLRHWYEEKIYVKVLPPSRGKLDCVVMLFDSPADPREYPWRTTWYAEHEEESTLAFYATDFSREMVGPGIALATYGGAMFLYPPVHIRDIWRDPRLDFAETLEERLLAAACLYSTCPHIALLSSAPPGAGWRKLAARYNKRWLHLPLSQFNDGLIQQLRMVHVLNGHQVRSFAADFIRKA